MRAFLLCSGAVVVGLLVWTIGRTAVANELRDYRVHLEHAPEPPAPSRHGGLVEDGTGRFLGDAVVMLTSLDDQRLGVTVITDSSGWWSAEIAPGRYQMSVYLGDYAPSIEEVRIPPSEKLITRLARVAR